MVFVNIITSLLVLTGVIIYRYVYPKKKINLFILLLIISILPIVSIFRTGTYESGDFNIHVYRAMAFYDSLKDGQFMPSWAGELNATYGYQLFIFNYSLPYYIISFFHFLGFSFISSMKLFLASFYIFSGITLYYFAKLITKNTFAAFTASILYLFAPYHLVDLHFRVTAGELAAFSLVPLLFYSIHQLIVKKNIFYFVLSGFSLALLNMSHMATAAFALLVLLFYFLFLVIQKKVKQPKKAAVLCVLSLAFGMLSSIQMWIPYLTLAKYTHGSQLTSGNIIFTPITELIYSLWRYGFLFQGPKGELSFVVGYIHLALLLFTVVYLFRQRDIKKHYNIFFWIFVSFLLIFFITPFSSFIWKAFPLMSIAMFSYRLLLITSFCISILAGFLVAKISNKTHIWLLVIFLVIGTTILNWGHRRTIPSINDTALRNNLPKSTYEGEAFCCLGTPIWIEDKKPWFYNIPKQKIEILQGSGKIQPRYRNSVLHKYISQAETKLEVRENTLYFPGWSAYIDDQKTPINYLTSGNKGTIVFQIPPGLHLIETRYRDLPVLLYSKYLAAFCLLGSIIYLILHLLFPYRIRKKRINTS